MEDATLADDDTLTLMDHHNEDHSDYELVLTQNDTQPLYLFESGTRSMKVELETFQSSGNGRFYLSYLSVPVEIDSNTTIIGEDSKS